MSSSDSELVVSSDVVTSGKPVTTKTKLPLRRPIPRKGHTKSRRGCYNCKRRKIKCQEKLPRCDHCKKAGLCCEYPPSPNQQSMIPARPSPSSQSSVSPSPMQPVQLRSTPGCFSLKDMKLFHHFLTNAYPHFPVGAEEVWIRQVPSWAYHYDFLIHGLLALSASHLSAIAPSSGVSSEALNHRVLAVRAFNAALSTPVQNQNDIDARLATAMVLTFQSSYIPDGLVEFFTMVRGCNLVAGGKGNPQMGSSSAFHTFRWDGHIDTMDSRLRSLPESPVNSYNLDEAMVSLNALDPLCETEYEKDYLKRLKTIVNTAYDSPLEAYAAFAGTFNWPGHLPHHVFPVFVSTNNITSQILFGHFIAFFVVLGPILQHERTDYNAIQAPTAILSWLGSIYNRLPEEFHHYLYWPMTVTRTPFVITCND